ncbi:MAG: hypothetical protein US60_C0003G0001, partial [Microgenomates group bacterium GW2011_GWC1_37_8]
CEILLFTSPGIIGCADKTKRSRVIKNSNISIIFKYGMIIQNPFTDVKLNKELFL